MEDSHNDQTCPNFLRTHNSVFHITLLRNALSFREVNNGIKLPYVFF